MIVLISLDFCSYVGLYNIRLYGFVGVYCGGGGLFDGWMLVL